MGCMLSCNRECVFVEYRLIYLRLHYAYSSRFIKTQGEGKGQGASERVL
jgi:hypothetical protein